jgi:type IV pilus assembly protein PilZ
MYSLLFGKKSDRQKNRPKSEKDLLDEDSAFPDSMLGDDSQMLPSSLDEVTVQAPAPGRPKVMSITIRDRKTLHAAYMPFLQSGGIFVPSSGSYKMGDEVFLLLKLVDSAENISIPGKVVWLTPEGAMSHRVAGIGVQFTGPEAGKVRSKIEGILGGALKSRRMTHTM